MARRKKQNEFPFIVCPNATTFISTGTADGDVWTTLVMPSDGYVGRAVIQGITNGTGTALVTPAIYSAASRGGTQLTSSLVSSAGTVYDLDAALGVIYAADGIQINPSLAEGARLFLNLDFDAGSASAAGTFGFSGFLVL